MTLVRALSAVLAQADPPDLVGRGSRLTYAGDPDRRSTVLLPLLVKWAQYRHLERGGDLP